MTFATALGDNALPDVSDDDIERLSKQTTLVLDEERRAIVRNMSRIDVRACPGSGKTTLLVAKLAILSSKWRWSGRGICVLSHTNVARKEIQSRFAQLPSLQRLNTYPHFVGTIQSFIDQFLGVQGALIAFGRRPSVIDNDRYRFEACKEFFENTQYGVAHSALRKFFNKNPQRTVADCIAETEYCDAALSLNPIPSKTSVWGDDTPTVKSLRSMKDVLSRRGFFRFQDMDSLALHYLEQNPTVVSSLRRRFPVVFVDEMQDTPPCHCGILEKLFGEEIVFQRIGDDRQAIYSNSGVNDEESESTFPSATTLSMKKSFRLSPVVSNLVKNICSDPVEDIEGNQERKDCRHTIFVFSRDSIANVLPSFAELVAEDIGTSLPAREVRAVGSVQKAKDGEHFPASIPAYWPDFDPPKRDKGVRVASLGGYLQIAAWWIRSNGDVGAAMRAIVEAISRFLKIQSNANCQIDLRPHKLLKSLQDTSPNLAKKTKRSIAQLCLKLNDPSAEVAVNDLEDISAILKELRPGKWSQQASLFWRLTTIPGELEPSDQAMGCGTNVFRHPTAHGNIDVLVDTIHSVKGETLRAILVLDTFQYSQHLATLVEKGYLLGNRPSKKPGKQIVGHLKRAFVATTRPTDLLCLALFEEHLTAEHRDAFTKMGWRVVDV